MSSDVERLRRETSLSETARSFGVDLEQDGDEWIGCCPFHRDDTPSFTVFRGNDGIERFHCFGCGGPDNGKGGDVLDFVKAIKGVGLKDAIRILGGELKDQPNIPPKRIDVVSIYAKILPVDPPREIAAGDRIDLYNPKRAGQKWEWGKFTPSMAFPYRRSDGSLMGYVLRREFENGARKETPMVMWVKLPDGKEAWCRYPFPKPRALYGLADLRAGQVVVVEGEKCKDRLAERSGRNVVSWPGGTYGIRHADWSPLAGRSVVIWPDADDPGRKTAQDIAAILVGLGCSVKIMDVAGKPDGWDAADAIDGDGWSKDQLDAYMRQTVKPFNRPAEVRGEGRTPDPPPQSPAGPSNAIPQARTVTQEQSEPATVTHIRTRQTVAADDGWKLELVFSDEGKVKPGVSKNWALFLENHPETCGVFAFDAFKHRIMLMRRPPWEPVSASWEPRTLKDSDYSEAVMWLEARYMTPKASNIAPVIGTVAERSSFDRLREYLEALEWDRKPRVARFVNEYLGVNGDSYGPVVGEKWLLSSVARGLKPGCKVDTMPILEGPQGALKSSSLKALYGAEFFTDELSDIGSKDAMMEMQGVWCIEIAEMHRFSASETNAVKKFLTRQIDRYRPPYGRSVIEAPRRVVLNGTINPEGNAYLRDPTGARRFWPMEVGKISVDKIARDRDQLWAEAVVMFKAGAQWWLGRDQEATAAVEQEKRTDVDVWTGIVAAMLKTRTSIAQDEIFQALDIPKKDRDIRHGSRVGRIMKKLGWVYHRDRKDGQDRVVFKSMNVLPLETDDSDMEW